MPAKKNIKTLYSKTNPIDITTLLTNTNIVSNLDPFLNQIGGTRTKKVTITNHKNKAVKNDKNNYEDNSDASSDSDTNSQYGKGDKNDIDENNDEDDVDEDADPDANIDVDVDAEPDIDVDADVDPDVVAVEEIEDDEENDEDVDGNKSENSDDDDDKETLDTSNKCYSKYAKEKDNDFDLDEYFKDDDIIIMKTGRVGKPILFKYEKVRLLCDRSRQLAEGAKPMIKNTTGLSHKEIAVLELKNKLIPLIIERPIPNAGSERWRLSELEIPEYD